MSAVGTSRRIKRGSGHSYEMDGRKVPGVTTILNEGVPKPALVPWAARMAAGWAVDHWDELAPLPPSMRSWTIQKKWQSKDAAIRGTAIHALAQSLAAGDEVEVPEHLSAHMDAYERFVDEWAPAEVLAEAVIGNRLHRYMGTLDVIADLADGRRWMLDWKTGSGVYPEAALQLAAYRNAEYFIGADGAEHPLPPVDATGVVWLTAEGYDLIPVETGPHAFHVFLWAKQIHDFRKASDDEYLGEPLSPPTVTA